MTRQALLMAALSAIGFAAPVIAAPTPKFNATVAENSAFADAICADADATAVLRDDFATAARIRLQPLFLRMTQSTRIVVPEAHRIPTQGYPNGFALENGRVSRVACSANIAMRINGKIVEYRGLVYRVDLPPGETLRIATIDPGSTGAFIDHVFIDNEPLTPGEGSADFTSAGTDQAMELMAMMDAGLRPPFTPEMRVQWRLMRLNKLLGPVPDIGAAQ